MHVRDSPGTLSQPHKCFDPKRYILLGVLCSRFAHPCCPFISTTPSQVSSCHHPTISPPEERLNHSPYRKHPDPPHHCPWPKPDPHSPLPLAQATRRPTHHSPQRKHPRLLARGEPEANPNPNPKPYNPVTCLLGANHRRALIASTNCTKCALIVPRAVKRSMQVVMVVGVGVGARDGCLDSR